MNRLNVDQISDFLDYIDQCHPGLERILRNLSYVLPKLIISGLPAVDLPILSVQFQALTALDKESFNHLLSPSGDVNDTSLEPLSYNREILSRQARSDVEVAVISHRDAVGDRSSMESTPDPMFDERQEFRSGSVTQPSLEVPPSCSYMAKKEVHHESRVRLPPIQELYNQLIGISGEVPGGRP